MLEALRQEADALRIREFVNFPGFAPDLHERIRKATVYVSSSDYEGISNSMLEALALGLPVVCTDCPIGGSAMAITDRENGLLIPTGDTDALAKCMAEIAGNPAFADRLSRNAEKARETFSLGRVTDMWERLLP